MIKGVFNLDNIFHPFEMCDDVLPDSGNTQTQTQNSQVDWSQPNTPAYIPSIWGRLYSTKLGRYCWQETAKPNPEYYDLIDPEFTLGRAMNCSFVMKRDIIKADIIQSVSKRHFIIKRDLSEVLSPAIITDLSYNGTYVNKEKIGKGNSLVLDDNDEISVTHPKVTIFLFKDLFKNNQDRVPRNISQKYYISRVLGQGACGVVKLVYNKVKCTKYAMKIIKKSRLTNGKVDHLNDPAKIMNEVNILKALRHPCVISTEEVFDSPEAVFIVLELMQGGELFDRIAKKGNLTEKLTRFLFRQMVLAVKYLHSQGITHRDLKPENVLLASKDDETIVKITDFGLSKFVGEDSFMKTVCGTPLYLAPEVLRANGQRSYGPEVDVWSLGVILFVCLVGYLPFSADYKGISLKDQILSGKYRFSHSHWKGISLQAKLLMKRMLMVNVEKRITLDQILNHKWMQDPEVTFKVERLLSQSMQYKIDHKMLTADLDEENNNATEAQKCLPVLRSGVASKRPLSHSFALCEPLPKKLRTDSYIINNDKSDDTSSTSSYCMEDEM